MKKYLILFVFVLVATVSVQAQVGLGLRLGANYSGFRGDDVVGDPDRLFGAHAGLTANLPISADNFFSIQPELLFSMKGAEYDNNKLRLYYVDVPVLARINAAPLYFEAGPQLSVRVGGESDLTDDLDFIRTTGFGYVAGVGIGTPMGVSLGVRYNGDISKLNDEGDREEYNDVFMLTLGYIFGSR